MALYEYECRQCGVRFERRQSVHDEPVRDCPDCGGAVRRILFPVGIIFKGSGFYVTDSRRPQPIGDGDSKPFTGDNGSKAKGDGANGTNGASEAKPAADAKASKETAGATS